MNERGMSELIASLTEALESNQVSYGVTGSVAAGFHGEPVSSIDVDIVTQMTPDQASLVARQLQGKFYADEQMLRRAATERTMANVMDLSSGLKGDISVLSDTPYHHEVLKRIVRAVAPAIPRGFWVVSPEDIILMKLVWRKDTQSQKQWLNALSVVRIQGSRLDWAYLRRWASELRVLDNLEDLARQAGI